MQNQYQFFCQLDHNKLNEVYLLYSDEYSNNQINNIVREKKIQLIIDYQNICIQTDFDIEVDKFNSIPETIKKLELFQFRGNSFNILFIPKKDETLQVYKILFIYCTLERIQLPDIIRQGVEQWNLQHESIMILREIIQVSQLAPGNISTEQSFSNKQRVSNQNSNNTNQNIVQVNQNIENVLHNNFVFPKLIPQGFYVNQLFGRKEPLY